MPATDSPVVLDKAGGLQQHNLALLLQEEYLVVQWVLGLIGVEFHRAKIIHAHLALVQGSFRECSFVHVSFLQDTDFAAFLAVPLSYPG